MRDAVRSAAFYATAFGFVKRFELPDSGGTISHVEMAWHDAQNVFASEGAWGGTTRCPAALGQRSPLALYGYVPDVDALHERAMAAGAEAESATPPTDVFWGDRMCSLVDPDGYVWNFATHTGTLSEATT